MRIVSLASSSCERDARIIRAAEAAAEAGHDVTIFAWGGGYLPNESVKNGVKYWRPSGSFLSSTPSRRLSIWKSARRFLRRWVGASFALLSLNAALYTKRGVSMRPDIVHAHDLYTLLAGARIAQKTGAKLIYDSHELEVGRNAESTALEKFMHALAERHLIGKADAVITVSESIAEFLSDRYGIPKPVVVHNTPTSSNEKPSVDIRTFLELSVGAKLLVYVGAVTFGRGLDKIVEAMPLLPDAHVAMIGPRPHQQTEVRLKDMAARLGVIRRLHFVDPVPADLLTAFVRTADISLVLVQNVCLSYKLSFPNKLLESVFADLPIIASNLPEYRRLVERTGAGLVVDETCPASIAIGINEILSNKWPAPWNDTRL